MRYRYKLLLSALGGFSFGVAVEAFILKRKHRKEQEEARETLRKYYKDKVSVETEKATEEAYEALDKMKVELEKAKSANEEKKMSKEEIIPTKEDARIISPTEFGEHPDYDRFYYTYCANDGGFYIDASMDTPAEAQEIQDVFLGLHPEEHFGEFEEDAVYIRNDDLKADIAVFLAEDTSGDQEDE